MPKIVFLILLYGEYLVWYIGIELIPVCGCWQHGGLIMQTKRIRSLQITVILLTVVAVASLTLAGMFGALYIKETIKANRLQDEKEQLLVSQAVPAISLDVGGNKEDSAGDLADDDIEMGASVGEEPTDLSELMQAKENEVEQSIKDRMKMLVTEDGSPLKMLRSFFPENLIYYFRDEYVFAPVLEDVKKHTLLEENFVKTEDGQMQYLENGVVTSHKGIDVSKYQGSINWAEVKADGVEYAFIRLGIRGYGSGKIVLDEFYEENMNGASENGVKAGVYFFTQAMTVEEAQEEAAFVIENLAGYDVSCPVVFDVELISNTGNKGRADSLTKEERTEVAIAFCEAIKAAGYTPMIYGNVICFTQLLDMTRLNDYEKWYAFYDDYMYMPYEVSCWQYTEKGKVKGITGEVDMNISYKLWQ